MDGNIAYQGYACEAAPYFKKTGMPCPTYQNPSDFYMKKLSFSYPCNQEDKEKIIKIDKNYREHLLPQVLSAIEAQDH
jgi:hypothetical protein